MTMSTGRIDTGQRGAALFFAIVFLIVMSLLALAAANTSLMQERMVGGLRNDQLALMGAESAIRDAELRLWNLNYVGRQPLPPCPSEGLLCVWQPRVEGEVRADVDRFRGEEDLDVTSINFAGMFVGNTELADLGGSAITARLHAEPRFIVEQLGTDEDVAGLVVGAIYPEVQRTRVFYRITARSNGAGPASQRIVQSIYSTINLSATGFNPDDPGTP